MSKLFPEWDSMSAARRLFGVFFLPIIGGIGSGLSGVSSTTWYLVNLWGAISGAVGIGAEHRSLRAAAWRGVASGLIYSTVLLVVLHVKGGERVGPEVLLPRSDVLLFALMAIPAVPLHLLGAMLRNRLSPVPTATAAPEPAAAI